MKKYAIEGFYIEDTDTIKESINDANFEELAKYSVYLKSIRNIERTIEKLASAIFLENLIETSQNSKIERKILTRDVIDIILIHTEWLRSQSPDRIITASKLYGIDKDYSILFFFDLKDDIFSTSSNDIDKYKIIKYNNITIYTLLIIMINLNKGQIKNFKYNKNYNFYIFEKIYKNLFNNLYLRVHNKDKILLIDIPLFSYCLFYLSGILLYNNIWLYDVKNIEKKNIQLYIATLHKSIIHTFIDLINSIFEAKLTSTSIYYENIYTRFYNKLINVYNKITTYNLLKLNDEKNNKLDSSGNLSLKKPIIYIAIDEQCEYIIAKSKNLGTIKLNILPNNIDINILSNFTHCNDGNFHNWVFDNKNLICDVCNISFNNLKSKDNLINKELYNNICYRYLFKKYCTTTGIIHNLTNNICNKCNKNIITDKPNNKELNIIYNNNNLYKNNLQLITINNNNNILSELEKINDKKEKELVSFIETYTKNTNNNLDTYINKFIDKLNNIIGNTIIYHDSTIDLYKTYYILNHDYLGNKLKKNIIIDNNKINFIKNHPKFKTNILYYIDNNNNIHAYYEVITLQYLGYSFINNLDNIIINKQKVELIIKLSLKDIIMLLGCEDKYYNLYHINCEYFNNTKYNSLMKEKNHNNIINTIIRTKIVNLRFIIERSLSIIYNIVHNNVNTSVFNTDEKNIINKYSKILNFIKISNESDENIFSNYENIIYNLHLTHIEDMLLNINKNFINIENIYKLNNNDSKLLYYLISEFNKIIKYNKENANITNIVYLIVDIIIFSFNMYYKQYSNFEIRKFDYYLINERPVTDNILKVTGNYNELTTNEEINNPDNIEELYTIQEEKDSYEINDYEVDDEFDGAVETLHGFDENGM